MSVLMLLRLIVHLAINVYLVVLFIRMLLDWMRVLAPRWYPTGVVYSLVNVVYRVTEPPLRWLRRYIRPLPLGAVQLDVSFMVLYFVLIVAQMVI